jgi:hypothetical protein
LALQKNPSDLASLLFSCLEGLHLSVFDPHLSFSGLWDTNFGSLGTELR